MRSNCLPVTVHRKVEKHSECGGPKANLFDLRTVPTNGKYFFPDNDYVRQVDHIRNKKKTKRKLGVTTHFSEISALQYGEKR